MEFCDIKAPTSLIFAGLLVAACGNDTDSAQTQTSLPETSSPVENQEVLSGRFLDSAVMGLAYSTPTQHGTTDIKGTFRYRDGETVTFYIGNPQLSESQAWKLGSTTAREVVTPLELLGTDTVNQAVRNLLRLLQSLDVDGDPSNGIELSTDGINLPDGNLNLNLWLSDSEFEVDPVITSYLNASTSTGEMVAAQSAVDHFQLTMNELLQNPTGNWNYTDGSVDGEATSTMSASIQFNDETHYTAQYQRPEDSGSVSAEHSINGMSLVSDVENFEMTLDGAEIHQYPEEFLDVVPEPDSELVSVALGLDANLRVLPNSIVLESPDGGVVLNYARGETTGNGTVAYLEINSPGTLSGNVGDVLQLEAVARAPSSEIIHSMQFSWSTSDPAIATVNSNGLVTAVSSGSVTIRVSAAGYDVSAQIEVLIENDDLTDNPEITDDENDQNTEDVADECPEEPYISQSNEEYVSQQNFDVGNMTSVEQINQQNVQQSSSGEDCVD